MTDQRESYIGLDLQEIIDLRWTLRGNRAKRWKMSLIPLGNAEIDELDRDARRRAGTYKGRIRCPSLIMAPHELEFASSAHGYNNWCGFRRKRDGLSRSQTTRLGILNSQKGRGSTA
jgi:hypothetical protein